MDLIKITIPDFMIVLREFSKRQTHTIRDLEKNTQITYAHVHRMKGVFLEKKWVTIEKERRHSYVTITESGRRVVECVVSLLEELGIHKDNIQSFRHKTKHRKTKEALNKQLKNEADKEAKKSVEPEVFDWENIDGEVIGIVNEEEGVREEGEVFDWETLDEEVIKETCVEPKKVVRDEEEVYDWQGDEETSEEEIYRWTKK